MTDLQTTFAAVVATKGRSSELTRLLKSLRDQTYPLAEIIIADQNNDDRVDRVVQMFTDLPINVISATAVAGVNAGRNLGLRASRSDYVFFPDDDCWYPNNTVAKVRELFRVNTYDVIVGRPTEEGTDRTINGRFLSEPQIVDRKSAWFTQIEWLAFFRRAAAADVQGFDESIGPGAGTLWGGHEIQDISLRLLDNGYSIFYDPTLVGHHAEVSLITDGKAGRVKGKAYARGLGYVLAKNGFPLRSALYWSVRPCITAAVTLGRGNLAAATYASSISWSRLSGYVRSKRLK